MNAPRHAFQMMNFLRPAALDVETNGPNAGAVQFLQLPIRNGLRHLRDSDKRWAKHLQSMEQITLIESLERAGHHRATTKIDRFHPRQIILAGKRVGHESLIRHDGKVLVDDMKMAIKIFRFWLQ